MIVTIRFILDEFERFLRGEPTKIKKEDIEEYIKRKKDRDKLLVESAKYVKKVMFNA